MVSLTRTCTYAGISTSYLEEVKVMGRFTKVVKLVDSLFQETVCY